MRSGAQAGYGFLDRAVHRFAFATVQAQAALSDVEDRLFAKRLAEIEVRSPVFITGLPRSGTTLLLELCAALPEFGAHTYRDMPFVLCPLLWSRVSGRFRRASAQRERAHGDGVMISFDSAEAFEEVVWKLFWPAHYRRDRVVPWDDFHDPEFSDYLIGHVKKIVALRCPRDGIGGRYVSKNNMNVARLPGLSRLVPSACVVVPFRDPWQHAASLLRQHRRFLEVHARDGFAKSYMAAIGHYDFGANLRPIDFDGWLEGRRSESDTCLGFWLEYWTACYRHVLERAGGPVHLVSYDRLTERPKQSLEKLAEVIGVSDRARFCAQAARMSAAKPQVPDGRAPDPEIIEQARRLHGELKRIATI